MSTRLRSVSLFTLLALFFAGCAADDEGISHPSPEPPTHEGPVDSVDLAELRAAWLALIDHYGREGVDFTDRANVEAASVAFLDRQFVEQPEQIEAGLTALWSPEVFDAVVDEGGYEVPPDFVDLRDAFVSIVASAESSEEILAFLDAERARRADQELTVQIVWIDVMERFVEILPAWEDGASLDREINWLPCILAVVAGAAAGSAIGVVAGGLVSVGTLAPVGAGVGLVAGAAAGAVSGCL